MKSFGIVSISYGRNSVLRLFCAGIKRLREETEIFIPCVIVGDADHKAICDEYHVHHIPYSQEIVLNNKGEKVKPPASPKWNIGVEYLMGLGVDYVTIMGSDDIMSTDLMKTLMAAMEKGYDLIGVKEIYFYDANGKHKGMLRKLGPTVNILGVARTISRRVIEQTHPMWRVPKSWGMDGDCLMTIWKTVQSKHVVTGVVVDVKTGENLNKFSFWLTRLKTGSNPEILYNILSEEEKQILNTL
jgi:hypothetical protein